MAPPSLLPNLPPPPGTYTSLALGTAIGLTVAYLLRSPLFTSPSPKCIPAPPPEPPSPSSSVSHPYYPPSILPGRRPFRTPYGTINIYEFGSPTGEKVLFLPGIGTPVLALGDMALRLAEQGYRVMLFDLFGRGYSDCPTGVEFDSRLYASQILMVLASSELSWTGGGEGKGFHLVGYSLGGGLAVDFARYFGHMVRSLVVVANGGLVRRDRHVGWKSKVLYSRGWLPEWVLEWAVGRRIRPSKGGGTDEVGVEDHDVRGVGGKTDHDANGGKGWDSTLLSKRGESQTTVADVMDWQVREHKGFVRAFRSSIRCAPIYDQGEEWREVGAMLEVRRRRDKTVAGSGRGKVLMVLGRTDSVVVLEEVVGDARRALGEDGVEVVVLEAGHEVAFTHGMEVADAAMRFWREGEGGEA
ncbi:Alpha/Beta hydrolase protein [Coniochaeta sp. 2T2.1]|nr:Alpha/Beta hydrolase protein [Coniochaeta sp. 2T2.1]